MHSLLCWELGTLYPPKQWCREGGSGCAVLLPLEVDPKGSTSVNLSLFQALQMPTNDYLQSPPRPFPAWLVGTPAETPTMQVSPPLGPEHPPSLGGKARAGESSPRDMADTRF